MIVALPPATQAQSHSFIVYNDPNYSGAWCYSDTPITANIYVSCNDQISSFQLVIGWSVRVYRDQNQNGPSVCFNRSDANLSDNTFEDGSPLDNAISSFVLYNQSWCAGAPTPAYPLEVYNDTGYSGFWCYSAFAEAANIYVSCNDQITSILLRTGWSIRLYRDVNQGGVSVCLNGSDPDLRDNTFEDGTSLNDAISSFILYDQANCSAGPPPPPPPPPQKPDITISALEVTQGIQNLKNEMPLVQDRQTAARAYVRSSLNDVPNIRARLHATRNGTELPGSPREAWKPITVRADGGNRLDLNHSFLFYVPPAWRSGTVTLRVEVNYDNSAAESDTSNNSYEQVVAFNQSRNLKIMMVPIHLHNHGDSNQPEQVYDTSNSSFQGLLSDIFRYHPIAQLHYDQWPTLYPPLHSWPFHREWDVSTDQGQSDVLNAILWQSIWNWDLSQIYWMGMIDPSIDTGTTLGIAYRSLPAAWSKMSDAGGPNWYIEGGETLSHELGHSKGMSHILCDGSEQDTDGSYPWQFPNCQLANNDIKGFYGLDVYSYLWNISEPTVISNDPNAAWSHQAFPMMGYQTPNWIAPYEYCKLLVAYNISCNLSPSAMAVGDQQDKSVFVHPERFVEPEKLRVLQQSTGFVAVNGLINSTTNTVTLDQIYQFDKLSPGALQQAIINLAYQRTFTTSANQIYTLVQLNSAGQILSSQDITFHDGNERGKLQGFLEVMPLAQEATRIQVRQGVDILVERVASAHLPTVHLLSPNGNEQIGAQTEIQWFAADPDGDPLTFNVLYSPDNGQTWRLLGTDISGSSFTIPASIRLSGSTQGRIRVVVNDGFWTTQDDSDGLLRVSNSSPFISIISPRSVSSVESHDLVIFQGIAEDVEDGSLSGSALMWRSNLDGDLGAGEELAIDKLSTGVHQITLTATDSSGDTSSSTIIVYVGITPKRAFLPIVIKP